MKFIYQSLYGDIFIEIDDDRVVKLTYIVEDPTLPQNTEIKKTPIISSVIKQLDDYFSGKRTEFNFPIKLIGTPFQKRVWDELKTIPYGETRTYGQIAKSIGKPNASRAVGGACHNNPICLVVPCHRVIGSNCKLTGFAGGLDIKEKLLQLEKLNAKNFDK